MKTPFVYFILFYTLFASSISAQKDTSEVFYDHFGNELIVFSDSTYIHKWRFDLMSTWSTGKVNYINDTMILAIDTIYDTVRVERCFENCAKCGCIYINTLALSVDKKSDYFTSGEYYESQLISVHQSFTDQTNKLYRKKNKLIIVLPNGKLFKTKQKPLWARRKYKPHYYLVEP